MKRPPAVNRPRPFTAPRRTPRSRPEAAAELTRIEYERDRIMRDLATIEGRKTTAEAALSRADARARFLRNVLERADGAVAPAAAPAPPPKTPPVAGGRRR